MQDHKCIKEKEIEQLKIDLAVAKSDISTVKSEISEIKDTLNKFNWKLISVLITGMGSLLLLLYGILSKG